ncbi:MAG: DUF4245 domain-containing protein [Microlunatus sp.]|nr:DUF4245 domain-containing protein [Microlunatus sp.]MDN5769885.1 DUF4245 domain-containing protein [Microlunatus sp.]MDN5803904.1 DUF4245 domain-containing protein [Microlunatus sp.]
MARPKKPATTGDMIRSLLVILIPVVLLTLFFSRNLGDYPVEEVNWRPTLAEARQEAPYPVLAPEGLPDSWRPTKVAWIPRGEPYLNDQASVRNLWQLGFLDPNNVYISVNQGDGQPERFVDETSRQGLPDGSSDVAGQTWQRRLSPDERTRSLVRSAPEVTTVVAGDAPYDALEAFASTLTAG